MSYLVFWGLNSFTAVGHALPLVPALRRAKADGVLSLRPDWPTQRALGQTLSQKQKNKRFLYMYIYSVPLNHSDFINCSGNSKIT